MTNENLTIAKGTVVTLEFTLKDAEGEVLDASADSGPLVYLHGYDNIVPGLEEALDGHAVGDHMAVVIEPDKGYGEYMEEAVQKITRDDLPEDAEVEVGAVFIAEDDDGDDIPFWVSEINGDEIVVDGNHPLAGMTLHFEVAVLETRAATEEELAEGYVEEDDFDCLDHEEDDE